ncbi:MAG: invasion associated locus B family protein [Pseudomonadota bacterium]
MRFVAALILVLTSAVAANAQGAPTLLERYNAWEAYQYDGGGQKVCYILSKPTALQPTGVNHGDIFFFISTRPAERVTNEVSILVGYPFDPGSEVTVNVDGRDFALFTKDDGAWVAATPDEQQLVAAMRSGRAMTVSGRSKRGTNTSYTFSLSGVTAGTNRIASCS